MTAIEPAGPGPPAVGGDDVEHLRLLAIFHYVVAGIIALISLLPGIQLVLGLAMASGHVEPQDEGARIMGWIFVGCAAFFMTIGFTSAALVAFAGRSLETRRRYTLCLVVATVLCMLFPFGTLLGVFTLVVLVRPTVKAMFDAAAAAAPHAARA